MPLIAINALQVANRSGTGYYSRKIIEHIPPVRPQLRYLIFLPASFRANPLCQQLDRMPNVRLRFVRATSLAGRILFEQLILPRILVKARVDLLHSLAFVAPLHLPTKSVVTVHDLTFALFPETITGLRRAYLSKATKQSVRLADRVIAVSEAVREDLVKHLSLEPNSVVAVPEGGLESPGLKGEVKALQLKRLLGWSERYVLFIGTMEPRKNLRRLLAAFSLLRTRLNSRCKLVIVGRKGWLTSDMHRGLGGSGIEEDVVFTGFLPDVVVISLMQDASLFVMPSLYEGFGLPLVTAMACQTPIAASRAGSIPEVVDDAAVLFDPLNVEEMAEAMHRILASPALVKTLVEAGRKRCERFSWTKCALETVGVYEQVLSRSFRIF